MYSSIASAPEVLIQYDPKMPENATFDGVAKQRFKFVRQIEYRGLTQAAAEAAANNLGGDLAGTILVDGTATSPTLHVDGFTNATGVVLPGTSVVVAGDDHVYHVSTLAAIASNEADLVLTENYLEPGTILVNGGSQTGTSLAIDGFTASTGYVRKGTALSISGDGTSYTVTAEAAIVNSAVTVTITPTLSGSPADDTAVTLSHPANNAAVTLGQASLSGTAVRTQGPMFTLRVNVEYYTNATGEWEDV